MQSIHTSLIATMCTARVKAKKDRQTISPPPLTHWETQPRINGCFAPYGRSCSNTATQWSSSMITSLFEKKSEFFNPVGRQNANVHLFYSWECGCVNMWCHHIPVASGKHINCLGVSSTYPEKPRDCRSNKKLESWKDTRSKVYPGSVFLGLSGLLQIAQRLPQRDLGCI